MSPSVGHRLMAALVHAVLRHPKLVTGTWILALAVSFPFAARLGTVVRGGADPIPGSETGAVIRAMNAAFRRGAYYVTPIVVENPALEATDLRFAGVVNDIAYALEASGRVRKVATYWNRGATQLLGRDRHSALLLVAPDVGTFSEAEEMTAVLRDSVRRWLPPDLRASVTGSTSVRHDLDRRSSSDLLEAERVGLPLTLLILLLVFRAPLAALLPLAIATLSITLCDAALYFASRAMPVSLFAQNTASMIGLGVGVDYSLFILSHFRAARRTGETPGDAARNAVEEVGGAVLFSGAAVAIGFLALLLVDAPFLRAIVLGGTCVVAFSAIAGVTLVPVILAALGPALEWPRRPGVPRNEPVPRSVWGRWAHWVMAHPWPALALAGAAVLGLSWPALELRSWNVSAESLPPGTESRDGYQTLRRQFSAGWMGPTVLLVEAAPGRTVWDSSATAAILATADRVARDPRVDGVTGFASLREAIE